MERIPEAEHSKAESWRSSGFEYSPREEAKRETIAALVGFIMALGVAGYGIALLTEWLMLP